MKKQHPCGTNEWEITRVGADIKIKCINCGRSIMLSRVDFNKKINNLLERIIYIIYLRGKYEKK